MSDRANMKRRCSALFNLVVSHPWQSVGIVLTLAFLGSTFVFRDWLIGELWPWLGVTSEGRESNSTTFRNAGLVVGAVIAIMLAVWRSMIAERQTVAAQRQAETAQQSLLNERYQKGAEMFGSEVSSARLGGIYALRQLSEEHPEKYHIFSDEVAFRVREESGWE